MARVPLLVGVLAVILLSDGEGADSAHVGEPASSGLAVFNRMGCGSCHRLAAARSSGPIGPNLDERLESHTADSLKAQILAPDRTGMMPTVRGVMRASTRAMGRVAFMPLPEGRTGT